MDTVVDVPDSFGRDSAAGVLNGEYFLSSTGTSSQLRVYASNFVYKRTITNSSYTALSYTHR